MEFWLATLAISNIYPIHTYVVGNSTRWRSESLRERYPTLQTTFPTYRDFSYDRWDDVYNCRWRILNYKKCLRKSRRRHTITASVILTAMDDSLRKGNGWFLVFEDDAILNPNCKVYSLPLPIPSDCEYVSIFPVSTNIPNIKINNYRKAISNHKGSGTVGFWFHTRFAEWILSKKYLYDPIDLTIFRSVEKNNRDICFIREGCIVYHDNNPNLRIKSS